MRPRPRTPADVDVRVWAAWWIPSFVELHFLERHCEAAAPRRNRNHGSIHYRGTGHDGEVAYGTAFRDFGRLLYNDRVANSTLRLRVFIIPSPFTDMVTAVILRVLYIDDLRVEMWDCAVPVAPATWRRVKQLYRDR